MPQGQVRDGVRELVRLVRARGQPAQGLDGKDEEQQRVDVDYEGQRHDHGPGQAFADDMPLHTEGLLGGAVVQPQRVAQSLHACMRGMKPCLGDE